MLNRFEQFTLAISGIYRTIQKIERREMEQYGLKGGSAQYLVALSRHPEGLTAAQLCELCDLDKAVVSRTVKELEQRGLLTRDSGATGYRAKLQLTPAGQQAADFVRERAMAAVEAAGAGLSHAERAAMYAALESIALRLLALETQGVPLNNKE